MSALRNDQILEDLYIPDTSHVGLGNLAKTLNIEEDKLIRALKVTDITDKLYPSNIAMKKWLIVFNLIIELIQQTEPKINKERALVKIRRWLNLPSIQLAKATPLQYMLCGKTTQVITLLEQLVSS
jgi:hypothetical protein